MSLVELTIATGIVALLAGVGLPLYRNARDVAHTGMAQAALRDSLLAGVNHATMTRSDVVLCPSQGDACAATHDWSHGWLAFADVDADREFGGTDRVIQRAPALEGRARLRSTTGRTRFIIQPGGGNAGSNVTFTFCDGRGPAKAVSLVVSNGGNMRRQPATASHAANCVVGT